MTTPTVVTQPYSADAVEAAMARVVAAYPYERPAKIRELLRLGVKLQAEVEALHAWLVEEWDNLDRLQKKLDDPTLANHPKRDQYVVSYQARDGALAAEIQRYTNAHNRLGRVLALVGSLTVECHATTAEIIRPTGNRSVAKSKSRPAIDASFVVSKTEQLALATGRATGTTNSTSIT